MPSLELNNLTKTFDSGSILAVDDLSMTIEDGEFAVIVGPSGCGKSTTLNMMAGLERPTSGSILLEGQDITSFPPQERDIAMVFQNYALYPHMNVRSNIGFGLKMSGDVPTDELNSRVRETAELLQISELLDQRPAELSGGQQQRVALGRAIVREPAVFLMDEPLSNLDAKLRTNMRTEIQQLQNTLNTTTIYVTHDQTEAMTMGDRIAVMLDGRLQQLATPEEVYHRPANQFVAGFIGEPSMNFFDIEKGADFEGTGELAFDHVDVTYHLSIVPERLNDAPSQLVLGIRPDHIELADGDADFEANVTVTEPMGEYSLTHFTLGDSTYTAKVDNTREPAEGSVASFSIPEEHIYVFNRSDGETVHYGGKPQMTA